MCIWQTGWFQFTLIFCKKKEKKMKKIKTVRYFRIFKHLFFLLDFLVKFISFRRRSTQENSEYGDKETWCFYYFRFFFSQNTIFFKREKLRWLGNLHFEHFDINDNNQRKIESTLLLKLNVRKYCWTLT